MAERSEFFDVLGIVIGVSGTVIGIFNPEIRQQLGLTEENPTQPVSELIIQNSSNGSDQIIHLKKDQPRRITITNSENECSCPQEEPEYPYGKGKGWLSFVSGCPVSGPISIWVDNVLIGDVEEYIPDNVDCDDARATGVILKAGNHLVTAKNEAGWTWESDVAITESDCEIYRLTCSSHLSDK